MDDQSILPKTAMKPIPQGTLNVMDNCAVKGIFSGVIGGGMGLLFGLFMGSFDHSVSMSDEYHQASNRGKIRMTLKDMASKSRSYGKNFAAVGLVYSAVECFIEKQRAKHDLYNVAAAGCTTGAVLSAGGGPQACMMGCAAFAAFSTAIDAYMDR